MITKLTTDKIQYYSINSQLNIAVADSLYHALRINSPYLALRTFDGTYPFTASSGNIWTCYYNGFDFFIDEFSPLSTLQKNDWSFRFSEVFVSDNYKNNFDSFRIQIIDPTGVAEGFMFSSKTPEDILKAVILFHEAAEFRDLKEFNLIRRNESLINENEKLKEINEELKWQLTEAKTIS